MPQTPAETLTGDGVTLRRWRTGDAALVHRAVTESLDHLAPWMPFAVGGYTLADGESFLASVVEGWDEGRAFTYAIFAAEGSPGMRSPLAASSPGSEASGGRPVENVAGACGLVARPGDGFEIGYWLHAAYTGRGLATNAAAALIAEAWRIGAAYVIIRHDEANVRSRAVAQRLGFRFLERRKPEVEKLTSARVGVDIFWRLDRQTR